MSHVFYISLTEAYLNLVLLLAAIVESSCTMMGIKSIYICLY